MTVYLGSLGRMVELYTTPSAAVVAEERYSFTTTLEGRRKAQVRPIGRRTWTLNAGGAEPAEQAALMAFAQGAWGRGPFVFVSADAPFVNMLDPAASTCDPAEMVMGSGATLLGSPPMLTLDGWAPRSVWKDTANGARFGAPTPVLPGTTVTGSAYVQGAGGVVRLVFLDALGAAIATHDSTAATNTVLRRSVTRVVPAGAVSVQLWVNAPIAQACMPAVTWTSTVKPWGDGQGCAKAVAHGVSRDLAFTSAERTYSNLSFTVTEVG